jgi:hypothetical protein
MNAVAFGDNRHSYAEIDVQDEHVNEKLDVCCLFFCNLSVSFSMCSCAVCFLLTITQNGIKTEYT